MVVSIGCDIAIAQFPQLNLNIVGGRKPEWSKILFLLALQNKCCLYKFDDALTAELALKWLYLKF